jgi:hypothetical protein
LLLPIAARFKPLMLFEATQLKQRLSDTTEYARSLDDSRDYERLLDAAQGTPEVGSEPD